MKLTVSSHQELQKAERQYWKSCSPSERLDQVERLRLESGKFLYDYPSRLQKAITVTRKE